ncbi:MAG: uroporphyrinogen decarboxylase family protein [Planctomycetota bacterium]|nr:uroporphyrinogen decarboxylase family protein [Planctomycetota bacterium]
MPETSRQRVLNAVNHNQPDRVPIDFSSHRASSIMAVAYRRLREYLGLPDLPPRIHDVIQHLAIVDDDVLERFGIDTIDLCRSFSEDETDWKPWKLPDGSDCLIPAWTNIRKEGDDWFLCSADGKKLGIQKPHMFNFDQTFWPMKDDIPEDLSNILEISNGILWTIPGLPNPAVTTPTDITKAAEALRKSTDKAIVATVPFGGRLMEMGQFLCRNDNFLMMLAAEPKAVHRLMDSLVEMYLPRMEEFLEAVGPFIDIVRFGDDLGMQTGPQISPAMYREFFKPLHSLLWNKAKEMTGKKVLLHCCGGIRPLLDDLIDAGLDAINPVQTSCNGMDPAGLKADFGDRLCFWGGGCDTQSVLPLATPEEVRAHVLKRLEIFSPGGGFVFQQIHNITAEVPPENIVAMFDAIAEFNG